MTQLNKPVTRATTMRVTHGKYRGRSIDVTLLPGNVLQFHIKGTRQNYHIALERCYNTSTSLINTNKLKKVLI